MKEQHKHQYFESIHQFKFLDRKPLGKGSFGQVKLALHIRTNKIYAIKIVQLSGITTQVGLKALQRETSIHSVLDHPHIIKLWEVFQEDHVIYMVMEYAERGNLFYFQNKHRIFKQEKAAIFFSQTLSAVEYLHSNDLLHRDLKPENLLLDKDNNIKICDFGWITQGIQEKRKTFCGTYEYMAPEMIFDRQYDFRVDVWALGILLYQLLHGFAPFEGEKVDEVREQMLKGELEIDPDLSENVQDLIFNILKVDPNERLSISQIKQHPWLKAIWNKKLFEIDATIQLTKYDEDLDINDDISYSCKKTDIVSLNFHEEAKNNEKEIKELRCSRQKKKQQNSQSKRRSEERNLLKRNQVSHPKIVSISYMRRKKKQKNTQKRKGRNCIKENKLSYTNVKNNYPDQIVFEKINDSVDNKQNRDLNHALKTHKSSKQLYEMYKKPNKYKNFFHVAGHRTQNSDFTSQLKMKKQSRLKTDIGEQKSSSKQVVKRFNTEVYQNEDNNRKIVNQDLRKKKSKKQYFIASSSGMPNKLFNKYYQEINDRHKNSKTSVNNNSNSKLIRKSLD